MDKKTMDERKGKAEKFICPDCECTLRHCCSSEVEGFTSRSGENYLVRKCDSCEYGCVLGEKEYGGHRGWKYKEIQDEKKIEESKEQLKRLGF